MLLYIHIQDGINLKVLSSDYRDEFKFSNIVTDTFDTKIILLKMKKYFSVYQNYT